MRMLENHAQRTDVEEEGWTQDTQQLSFLYPASYAKHLVSSSEFSSHAHSDAQSSVDTVDWRWGDGILSPLSALEISEEAIC